MLLNKKKIGLNIFFSLSQIVITGLVYYFLYKFLLTNLGAEIMGVWAIVLSISSTANIANLGIGSGVIRYTALFNTNEERAQIDKLVHTSVMLLAGFFLVVIIVIYFISPVWLHAVVKEKYYAEAMSIVPYSLLCLLLNAISGVYAACLDGLQKNYVRSIVFVLSFVMLILFSYLLVPVYGLLGVAYAQLIQAVFLLTAIAGSLSVVLKGHRIFAFKWDKEIFKKIFSFGVQEQVISICQLCFDPLTKSLLGGFGSLSMVTYYEMANRLVLQLRGLLVSANQVLIPIFTSAQEKSAETGNDFYKQVFSLNSLMTTIWIAFLASAVIPISKLWLGSEVPAFIYMTILLSVAYFFNIIISPAYFSNMGSARLRGNVIGNIIIAVLNVLLCYLLGYYFQGYGVVIGWTIALSAGSLYILFAYHQRNQVAFSTVFNKRDATLFVFSIVGAISCFLLFDYRSDWNVWGMLLIVGAFMAMLGLAVYKIHPAGDRVANMLRRKIKP